MKLKRFDNNLPTKKKKVKQIIVVLCICLVAVISVASYAIFQVRHSKPIAEAKVGKFKNSDIVLEILIDGEKSETFPEKESSKVFKELACTNGGVAEWDSEAWELSIIDISGPTECTVSFESKKTPTAADNLTELAKSNTTEMFIDDTEDANVRYMGADPNNYVDIGNGNDADGNPILWRIIGVMNNVDDGTGKKETRVKIIRESSIERRSWDYRCTGTYDEETKTCSSSSTKNNWEIASLNKILNEAFYDSTETTDIYKNGYSNNTDLWEKLDYSNNGLGNAKSLIEYAVYHLGGPTTNNYRSLTALGYYEVERSETRYEGNTEKWLGKVGLMYSSDYGYATSGGTIKNKEACATKELYYWNSSDYADCKDNNWIFTGLAQWTITPNASYDSYSMAVGYSSNGSYTLRSNTAVEIRPVVYLRSDVKITGGKGTKENPYTLGL